MIQTSPPFPPGRPHRFRATVHGTVFGGREELLSTLEDGDAVALVPDPPGQEPAEVWVHLTTGDPIGHLPPEIGAWLCPWLQGGGLAHATALRVRDDTVPSWRRVVLEVVCAAPEGAEGVEGDGE